MPTATRSAPSVKGARAQTKAAQLYLNGVLLMSNKPQAILENAEGRTFIVGVGESVEGQKVTRIKPDRVEMRHGGRTYALKVRE
jgi:hypothetical protein